MIIRQEMHAAARRGAQRLKDPAATAGFLRGHWLDDGGFADRSGKSDLYYTVFGLQASAALDIAPPVERVGAYVESFGRGEGLDLVHAACLVRCRALLPGALPDDDVRDALVRRVEAHRAADGGYARQVDQPAGTAYGCFLALAALQDLAAPLPEADEVAGCLASLASGDGAYANSRDLPIGSVPATAAAVSALHHLARPATPEAPSWLLARHSATGGFVPVPGAHHADLLSTATALHALSLLEADLSGIRRACLRFVRSLQRPGGGFAGHADDPTPDGEYTYYALLALGHLEA